MNSWAWCSCNKGCPRRQFGSFANRSGSTLVSPRPTRIWENFCLRAGSTEAAVSEFREGVRLDRDANAHACLATGLAVQKKLDEAIVACKEAIAIDPSLAAGHLNLGIALARKGDIAEATRAYRDAKRLQPDKLVPRKNTSRVIKNLNPLDEAIAEYCEARGLQPGLAGLTRRGVALRRLGELDQSIRALREAIRLDPSSPTPRRT